MFEVVTLLFDICLFKKGPQDLPPSVWLLRLLVVIDVLVSFLMVSIRTDWFNALLQAIVGALLIVGFSWLMLYLARKPERFYQTGGALLGADAMISFFCFAGHGLNDDRKRRFTGLYSNDSVNDLALGGYRAYFSQCIGTNLDF